MTDLSRRVRSRPGLLPQWGSLEPRPRPSVVPGPATHPSRGPVSTVLPTPSLRAPELRLRDRPAVPGSSSSPPSSVAPPGPGLLSSGPSVPFPGLWVLRGVSTLDRSCPPEVHPGPRTTPTVLVRTQTGGSVTGQGPQRFGSREHTPHPPFGRFQCRGGVGVSGVNPETGTTVPLPRVIGQRGWVRPTQ